MSQFHKIWIEVDVSKDTQKKTEMLIEVMNLLKQAKCVVNVTKCEYKIPLGPDDN